MWITCIRFATPRFKSLGNTAVCVPWQREELEGRNTTTSLDGGDTCARLQEGRKHQSYGWCIESVHITCHEPKDQSICANVMFLVHDTNLSYRYTIPMCVQSFR